MKKTDVKKTDVKKKVVKDEHLKDELVLPEYYVGIGASAGGLEALESFVKNIPDYSNHAYIIVQHLSPDFKSMMSELLARHTHLSIEHITEDVRLKPNHIYLAPPRKYVLLAEGKALLVDQMEGKEGSYPIDVFFRSLAEDQLHHSIAIVLSGTGSDGSRGILAIKEVGGLVVVQEPADATFSGMPVSAIKAGAVDMVLKAEEMVEKLLQYTTHPVISGEKSVLPDDEEKADHALREIYELLSEHCNIDFTHYKGNTVHRRIQRRLGINGLANVIEYYSFLLKNPKELKTLSQDMLIGVTRFFRDTEAFESLETIVIPDIINKSGDNAFIRVWSACCSTGEEAYSLAILIDEALKKLGVNRSVRVFATDVDAAAIADASLGKYSPNIANDMSEERLNNYFIKSDECYTIAPHIRQMVVFAQHNLLQDPPFSNCQLAVCRNALIYFQAVAQKRILSMLHFALNREGYLFLGSSETLGDMQNYFEKTVEKHRLYRKTNDVKLMVEAIPPKNVADKVSRRVASLETQPPSVNQLLKSTHHVQKLPHYVPVLEQIIEDYAPPAIVLSEDMHVLHVFGDVSPYTQKIKPGRFTSNLADFILDGLAVPIATATYRAKSTNKHVNYKDIRFTPESSSEMLEINLRVLYLNNTKLSSNYVVVLFEDQEQREVVISGDNNIVLKDDSRQLIVDLEEALRQKQEDLQVTVEELQTTNEELQSSNEELMAANEELQSTNEELESVNEELYSVNAEYQEKIEAISQLNTDIDNVITSGRISFIFLDDALIIRKFSEDATKDIHLLASDLGRPFHHISHRLDYDDFLKDIGLVMRTEQPVEIKVNDDGGKQKLVRISPYVDEHQNTCGCVIGITDISDIAVLETRLTDSWKELRSTLSASLLHKATTTNILIVDDEYTDRKLIINALKKGGTGKVKYVITEAETFAEAQQLLKEKSFDICILDFHLDGHKGFELIAGLNELNSKLAFIILSGAVTDKVREDAIKYGVYDVIDKDDVSPALMHRSIRYTLSHQQTERFLIEQDTLHLQ